MIEVKNKKKLIRIEFLKLLCDKNLPDIKNIYNTAILIQNYDCSY